MKLLGNNRLKFAVLLCLLPLLFIVDLLVGSADIALNEIWLILNGNPINEANSIIVLESRLPKAVTAVFVGIALSISGLLMQNLFQNPLAGPYILGVSSGAGLGVAILIMGAAFLGLSIGVSWSITLAAMLGSILVLMVLFFLSMKIKDVMTLLILGVMIGAIATALIGILQFFSTDIQLKSFMLWTLGSLENVTNDELPIIGFIVFAASTLVFLSSKSMNALLLGEEYAKSIGVSIVKNRLLIILCSGCLAGVVTAYCGPIGFVGIVVPHLCRLWFQTTDHLKLIPAVMLMGASVLLFSDVVSTLPLEHVKLPINSITALMGIPIILWIILNRRTISSGF